MKAIALKYSVILWLVLQSFFAFSQGSGKWIWLKPANFDTLSTSLYGGGASIGYGIFSSGNEIPGGLAYAYWTDKFNNFWVYGAKYRWHIGTNTHYYIYRNWFSEYNPSILMWGRWFRLATLSQSPTYGIRGVFSINNDPGGRKGGLAWTDNNGYLWLYGGENGGGTFNDLWKYDIGIHQWCWVAGGQGIGHAPVYGTQGVAAPSNTPWRQRWLCDQLGR